MAVNCIFAELLLYLSQDVYLTEIGICVFMKQKFLDTSAVLINIKK